MATVTGVTAAKAEEIKNNTIISARIANGVLYFKKGDGITEFNVGKVVYYPYESYPIGTPFYTEKNVNPSTILGGGTWVRYAKGKFLVGLDEAQTEFNTVNKEGGLKRVKLTSQQSGNPFTNLVRKLAGGNMYFNVGSDLDGDHRAELLPQSDAVQDHENLPPYRTLYCWIRTA